MPTPKHSRWIRGESFFTKFFAVGTQKAAYQVDTEEGRLFRVRKEKSAKFAICVKFTFAGVRRAENGI